MAKTIKLADVVPSRFAHLTPPSEENIERILADLVDGSKVMLNEPHVIREGDKYELLAGHDRVEAARRAGWTTIQVREFITLLTDDAILAHFCRENLLRKEVSKAAIAGEWLRKHPEWSDGKIAEESGCSHQYVHIVRDGMLAAGTLQVLATPEPREGRDGKTYRPRQVRGNVPSGKTIPHPTAKVPTATPPKASGAEKREAPEARASTEPRMPAKAEGMDSGVGAEPTGATAPLPESEPSLTPAVVEVGAASEFRMHIGDSLPSPDDPATTVGLTYADRRWFLSLSTWAIRIAGKCPQQEEAA